MAESGARDEVRPGQESGNGPPAGPLAEAPPTVWADPEVTPIAVSPWLRAVLIAAALAAVAWLLWTAPTVPTLLLGGGTMALVLSFPVRLLSRLMPRWLAILLVVTGVLVLLGVALLVLIPLVIDQLSQLILQLPTYANDAERLLRSSLEALRQRGWLETDSDALVSGLEQEAVTRGQTAAEWLLGTALDTMTGAIGTLLTLVASLFVALYLLADFGRFRRLTEQMVPPRFADDVAALWQALDSSLSRYLGGLLISITLQGAAMTVVLALLDVPFALLLGLWTSATAVLPYLGAFLGATPALLAAFFVSPTTAVVVAIAYLTMNQIEGNLLTPRIQGEAVRVHPLLIFLGVIAGWEIGGLMGAALAVPVMAIGRVLVEFFADRLYVPYAAARAADPVVPALTTGRAEPTAVIPSARSHPPPGA